MKNLPIAVYNQKRRLAFSVMVTLALLLMSLLVANDVSANHPVLVEGNCDSPVPGTTLVAPGTCGDFDGDGRIGTAEDTDGTDRIFGTINAALGPGTGAAAGTGANMNGSVTIVESGRFAESVLISPGSPFGLVTLQAAPGVNADINAVLQGDPAGLNNTRQAGVGIDITSATTDSKIVLRNLTIRNFATGIVLRMNARVTMDNCRLENNLDYGVRLVDTANVSGENLRIASTGHRVGTAAVNTTLLGHGISFEGNSAGTVFHSQITGSFGSAILNGSVGGATAVRYYEVFLSHNGSGVVNATRENTP